jgi:hypothetical protein
LIIAKDLSLGFNCSQKSTAMNIKATWTHPVTEKAYTIEANVNPARKGKRAEFDRFAEPDEPEYVEILSIKSDGVALTGDTFNMRELRQIEAACIEAAIDQSHDEPERY